MPRGLLRRALGIQRKREEELTKRRGVKVPYIGLPPSGRGLGARIRPKLQPPAIIKAKDVRVPSRIKAPKSVKTELEKKILARTRTMPPRERWRKWKR